MESPFVVSKTTLLTILCFGILFYYLGGGWNTITPQEQPASSECNSCAYGSSNAVNEFNVRNHLPEIDSQNTPSITNMRINYAGSTQASPIDSSTYSMSDSTADFYRVFQDKLPGLSSSMPLGWRDMKKTMPENKAFQEFERYTISKPAMQLAENLKALRRIGETQRDSLSRTLGQRSLLREIVSPMGSIPLGNSSKLFNDSSVRQTYIANITGAYPELPHMC